jgi:hypothetical protein
VIENQKNLFNMEKIHYIYTDNKFFRKLIKKNNEEYWNVFYDSMAQALPSLHNGLYRQIFTCFSFLEAIGEGRIRTKYSHKLNLNKFLLKHLDSLNEELLEDNDKEDQILGKQLDAASLAATEHFKSHPELSKEKLLKKIDDQLERSKSQAANELIQNTLGRFKNSILKDYEACLDKFSSELGWDSICSFDFLQLNKNVNINNDILRKRFIKIKEMLLHVFHDAQVKGRDLNSFRLCEAIQKERLTSKEFIKKIESENGNNKFKISIPGMLKEELDLCDVDVIHYATLGYFDPEFKQTYPTIVFTCDDRKVIKTRILLQLSILRFMCNNVIGSKLKLVPGEIHFIDSNTGRINAEPLIIAELKESETFEIKLDPLPLDSESYVEFVRATPVTASLPNDYFMHTTYEPQSFDELQKLLETRKNHLFRGQSPHNRELNSTLARELKGQTSKLPRVYIPELPLAKWPFKEMHRYHWIILRTFVPDDDVLKPLDGRGDPLFEIIRYIQMNPSQEKIRSAIPDHPTPTLEFSESSDMALYFSSYKENEDGGIYCLKKSLISTFFSFKEALDAMITNNDSSPCLLDPLAKINDLDDPKPKRQQAAYIFQRNLRCPINQDVHIEKIVIKKELYPFVKKYLEEKGITKDFIYPKKTEA